MTGNPHRIHRQVLELDFASPLDGAFALQEQAARPFRDRLLPGLEALFDRLAGPGRLLRLERLEIDLGELRGGDWPAQLLGRLAARLEEPLAAAAARELQPATPLDALDAAGAALEQLLFFLAHGRLPWWGSRPGGAWRDGPPAGFGAGHWRALGDLLQRDPRARRRLIEAVGDGYLAVAVAALAGLAGSAEVLRLLAPVAGPGDGPFQSWRRRFWTRLLDVALSGPPDAAAGRRLMRRLLAERLQVARRAGRTAGPASPRTPGVSRGPALPPALPAPWQGWLAAALARSPETAPAPLSGREPAPATVVAGSPEVGPSAPLPRAQRPARAERGSAGPDGARAREEAAPAGPPADLRTGTGPPQGLAPIEDEEVFVAGAGVVILHPFLAELFASRGLLAGTGFRDESSRRRAVHLLGYLTFGAAAPEYDLLLAKLLCGMAWEELLPAGDLHDGDRAAADELLAAVLGHWRALRSSSAAWLREQFFLREGALAQVDHGWKLTIERRAQDVLLARLPWGVGTVRLPWLAEVVHVRWTETD